MFRASSRRFPRTFRNSLPLIALLTLVLGPFPRAAFADQINASGDQVTTTGNNTTLNFGNVCANTTVTKAVTFVVQATAHNGNGNSVYGNNGNNVPVVVAVTGVSGSGIAASVPAGAKTITLPGNWVSLPNKTLSSDPGIAPTGTSGTVTSNVTLVTGNAGTTFSGAVNYSETGPQSSDPTQNIVTTTTVNVSATVISAGCDTTPPTLHLPGNITQEATSALGNVVTYTATATDNIDPNPTVTCAPASGAMFAIATTTVNCTATDASGNKSTGSFTVTVQDTTGPVFTYVPSNQTLEATGPSGAVATYTKPTATDAVDGTRTVTCSPASGSTFPLGQTPVVCTASDTRGNTSSSSLTITVQDTTAPVIANMTNVTAEATSLSGATVTYTTPTATDLVDGTVNVSCDNASGSTFPLGTTTVNCSATDKHSNTATKSFSVLVQDTTAPVLVLPQDFSAEATGPSGAAFNYSASASDAVDGPVTPSCIPASGATFALGATTVSCSATDKHSNTANGSFKVTVQDTTPPALTVSGDVTAEATGSNGAAVTYTAPIASDLVDGSVTASCDKASGSTFPLGTSTVTCSATDAHGNKTSKSFNVAVQDTTAPTLKVPASVTSEATSASGATVTYSASATDIVDGTDSVSCSPASGSVFSLGTTAVTCSATDTHGNTGMASFNVTVQDTTAPHLTLPADQTLEATGPDGSAANFTTSATDTVDGNVAVTCKTSAGTVVASGQVFPIGATTMSCVAVDNAGNRAEGSFTITVQDTTAPDLAVPSDITAEATGPNGAKVSYDTSATDIVDGAITPSCSTTSGSIFALGTTTVTCSATDKHNNAATKSFKVTVQDTTAPAIADMTNVTAEATSASGATVTYTAPAAIDLVDGPVNVSCDTASGATFPLGTTTITCSAKDAAGNQSSKSFVILVQDTTAPVLMLPDDPLAEATSAAGAPVSYKVSASDLVDGPVTPSCSPASGTTFALDKTTTVNCSATDQHNNTAKGSFTVTVRDTTPPALTQPKNVTAEATGPNGAVVTFDAPTAIDLVDGADLVTCSTGPNSPVTSGTTFPLGDTTVTCFATDAHGNAASVHFTVTVQDTTPPVVTVPADQTAEATGPDGAKVSYDASAKDIVDGPVTPTCSPASGSVFSLGTTTVTCSATDAHGNTAGKSFKVTVQDTTPPALALPADFSVEATGPDGATASYIASATDLVDGAVAVSCDKASGATFPLGDTKVTCSATDAHGNQATDHFTVTVKDTTPPTIVGTPDNMKAEATGPNGATVTYTAPSASDLVDGTDAVTCTPGSGSIFTLDVVTTVTCSATDKHGNTGTSNFTIKVQDTTAPLLALPKDILDEATGPTGAVVSYEASAQDIVDGPVTPSCNPASGSAFALGDTSVGCSATDKHSNTSTGSFKVTVQDTTPPVLTVSGNKTAEATGPDGAAVTYDAPSATDLVDGTVAASCDIDSGSTFSIGTITVNCSATDKHGNKAAGSFTVTVVDTTPPSLSQPKDITAEATGSDGAAVTYDTPSATDLVDGTDAVTCDMPSGANFPLGLTTVTCSASDAHGNAASVHFTVTVQDTTPPVVTVPADQTAEATGPDGAQVAYSASATDLVDGSIVPSCTKDSGTTFPLGATTVTCSATDAHGNAASKSFTVTVNDTTPPTINGTPADVIAEATGASGATVTYNAPNATDLVDGTDAVTCTPASGATFALDVATTVTCSATDAAGNVGKASFTIKVQDTTAPLLALPKDILDEATGPTGAAVNYVASATDIVDGAIAPSCNPASGSTFALDATTAVNCSATDAHKNTSNGSFKVTVQDTTPPALTLPADKTVEATGPAGASVTYGVSAVDLVDGAVSVSCDRASGATFALDVATTVTCSATDKHHNTSTGSFKVTVQDTTKPTLNLPSNIATTATGATGAKVSYSTSATDIVDGAITPTCGPASGSLFAPGTTVVNCSATDAHGNTATGSFKVTVTFGWSGILQPINNDGSSVFKQGSTIPVKFQLTGASAGITNAVVKLYWAKVASNVVGTDQAAVSTSAADVGNTFRYDASGALYIFNLNTKGLTPGTYQLRLDFGDCVKNTVQISLKP